MTSATLPTAPARSIADLVDGYHPHLADLTYVDNMPWLSGIVRAVAESVAGGRDVTDRQLDIALVAAERDHRDADTRTRGAAPAATAAPAHRTAAEAPEGRRDVEGVVAWRMRRSHRGGSRIRVLVECPGYKVWLTWPENAVPVRPGDTVAVTATLTRVPGHGTPTARGTAATGHRRVARPHQQ